MLEFKNNRTGERRYFPLYKNMGNNPRIFYADDSYGLHTGIERGISNGILNPVGDSFDGLLKLSVSKNWQYVK